MFFEIYEDDSGEWRWRLRNRRNRKIIADSAEGYQKKGNLMRAINKFVESFNVLNEDGGIDIVEI